MKEWGEGGQIGPRKSYPQKPSLIGRVNEAYEHKYSVGCIAGDNLLVK